MADLRFRFKPAALDDSLVAALNRHTVIGFASGSSLSRYTRSPWTFEAWTQCYQLCILVYNNASGRSNSAYAFTIGTCENVTQALLTRRIVPKLADEKPSIPYRDFGRRP